MNIKSTLNTLDILDPIERLSVVQRVELLQKRLRQFKINLNLSASHEPHEYVFEGTTPTTDLVKIEDALDNILSSVDFSAYSHIARTNRYHKFSTKSWKWALAVSGGTTKVTIQIPRKFDNPEEVPESLSIKIRHRMIENYSEFHVGDKVQILYGQHKGKIGIIGAQSPNKLFNFIDIDDHELFPVHWKDLRKLDS